MKYYLDVYSPRGWEDSKEHGLLFSGFPENRWKAVQRINENDILICYMKDKSVWFAAFEVMSKPYWSDKPRVYTEKVCPCRVDIRKLVVVEPEKAIPTKSLLSRLKLFAHLKNPANWGPPLRTSPRPLYEDDGKLILEELNKRSLG